MSSPDCDTREPSKSGKALCGLDSSWSPPQVPCLNGTAVLLWGWSALLAECCQDTQIQVFWPGSLVRRGWELYSAISSYHGRSRLGRPAPHWVPWSHRITVLAPQMSKAAGWDCCLDAAGRILVYQDQCWFLQAPTPCVSHFPSDQPLQIPLQSPWVNTGVGAPNMQPTVLGELNVHLDSFSTGGIMLEDLWAWCCPGLWVGQGS